MGTTTAPVTTRRTASLLAALLLGLVLGACSDEAPPGERAPALAERLDKVDEAVAEEDYEKARREVEDLVGETAKAQVNGDITDEQAKRILEAARDVLEELPAPDQAE